MTSQSFQQQPVLRYSQYLTNIERDTCSSVWLYHSNQGSALGQKQNYPSAGSPQLLGHWLSRRLPPSSFRALRSTKLEIWGFSFGPRSWDTKAPAETMYQYFKALWKRRV